MMNLKTKLIQAEKVKKTNQAEVSTTQNQDSNTKITDRL